MSDNQIGLARQQVGSDLSLGGRTQALRRHRNYEGRSRRDIIGGLAGLLAATGVVAIPGLTPLLAGRVLK